MKEFLNEDKKPFSELSPEEMHCVVTNEFEVHQPALTSGYWVESDRVDQKTIDLDGIYRTKPAKKLVVPWDALKPEYICAAKYSNGSVVAFTRPPHKVLDSWQKIPGSICVNLLAFAGVDGDGVDWENSLTFRDGEK